MEFFGNHSNWWGLAAGIHLEFVGIPWNSIGFVRIHWDPMEFVGIGLNSICVCTDIIWDWAPGPTPGPDRQTDRKIGPGPGPGPGAPETETQMVYFEFFGIF